VAQQVSNPKVSSSSPRKVDLFTEKFQKVAGLCHAAIG